MSKVPEYLIQIFEEAVANNNYNIDELFEKANVQKHKKKKQNNIRKIIKKRIKQNNQNK